jgi:hypothetical protein
MTISPSGGDLEMLRSVRDRLSEAIRDPECAPRDLPALARRVQEVGKEIVDYDPDDVDELKGYLELLQIIQATITRAVNDEECPIRELSPLTRRLQSLTKEIATLKEQLRQKGIGSGGANTFGDRPFDRGSI